MKPWHHATSTARKLGGTPEAYMPLNDFLDQSKFSFPDIRHRLVLHSTFGIELAVRVLGPAIRLADGAEASTLEAARIHVLEDCADRIPTPAEWVADMTLRPWMGPPPDGGEARRAARRSARRWGGRPEDYLAVHEFVEAPCAGSADPRLRAALHHCLGLGLVEKVFGPVMTNADGRTVCVRDLVETHVAETFGGFVPELGDWLRNMAIRPWMHGSARPGAPTGRRGRRRPETDEDPIRHADAA